ncbi:hypothetical protein JW935_15285 [candidate division KSB1 bacterium]|nr:hypothetical protein [candidate division KSB1 bacterium]
MYRKINDFITDWKSEQDCTLKIFSKIPDKYLSAKAAENVRSLGRLAWHITQTLTEMPHKAGILSKDSLDNMPVPESFAQMIDIYKKHSQQLVEMLQKNWQDADLTDVIEVYGQKWEKRKILSALVNHQIHHRAQMTVLMRLENIEVPGIYGPSKEEWISFGMTPPE